jgi:glycerophosphoryl diester phosphodiesterase
MHALRLAHRGDWRRAPENSLAALQTALANPSCDGLEIDVRTSADGVPVLVHDETLARVQRRPERVVELTAAELASLGIPTLAELLDAVPARAFLDVELKPHPTSAALDVLRVRRGDDSERTVVSSFYPETLAWLSHGRVSWPTWLNSHTLSPSVIDAARDLGCRGVSVNWRAIDSRTATAVLETGLTLAAWTVRRRDTFRRLERLGVSAMCVEAGALDG